jgi:hypothetical protein
MLITQLGGDTVLTAVAPEIMLQPGETPDPAYFAYRLGTGFFFIALVAVHTALLAGWAEMKHALGLAVVASILEVQYHRATLPLWYSIELIFFSMPSPLSADITGSANWKIARRARPPRIRARWASRIDVRVRAETR